MYFASFVKNKVETDTASIKSENSIAVLFALFSVFAINEKKAANNGSQINKSGNVK